MTHHRFVHCIPISESPCSPSTNRERIVEGFAPFGLQQSDQRAAAGLQNIACAFERLGAGLQRRRAPGGEAGLRRCHSGRCRVRIGFAHAADRLAVYRRPDWTLDAVVIVMSAGRSEIAVLIMSA